MGCDIHLWAETHEGGVWRNLHPHELGLQLRYEDEPDERCSGYRTPRDYLTFTALAGIPAIHALDITPIASPRGLPDDASHQVKAAAEAWNGDGHTHSWLGLPELETYGWFRLMGKVHKSRAAENLELRKRVIEMDRVPAGPLAKQGEAKAWHPDWLFTIMAGLNTLDTPSRIVFWFDN